MIRKPQVKEGSVYKITDKLRKKGKKILFYAGVNDWQTGMLPTWWDKAKIHSPFFIDTYDALTELSKVCEKNDWYLLFKPHPNVNPLSFGGFSERIIMFQHANILECIERSDVCISLCSTVLYTALVLSCPAVLLGRNSLSGSNCVYEYNEFTDLETLIKESLNKTDWDEKREAWQLHSARLIRYYLYPYSVDSGYRMEKSHVDIARFLIKDIHC